MRWSCVGTLEPLLVERRLAAQPHHRLVDGHQAGLRPDRVVQLRRLARLAELGVPRRVAGALERQHRDVVHLEVVGVRVAALVVAVGDDHLRPRAADDRDQPSDRPRRSGLVERLRVVVRLGVGHARVAVAEHHDLVEADDLGRRGELGRPQLGELAPSPPRGSGRGTAGPARAAPGSAGRPPRHRCSTPARCARPAACTWPPSARPSTPRRRDGRGRTAM